VKSFSFIAVSLALAFPGLLLADTGHVRDLGESLAYLRIEHILDQPDALPAAPSAVLDLRYATGDDAAAGRLQGWLRAGTAERRLLLVLANPETAAPLRQALVPDKLPARVLVVGRAGGDFAPDIPVVVAADAEHAAWTAATGNEDITRLLTDNPGKIRQDEAAVVRRHQNGGDARTTREAAPPAEPGLPPDRVLQRAVQLHRGLSVPRTGGN
jgi:hypothetical protein